MKINTYRHVQFVLLTLCVSVMTAVSAENKKTIGEVSFDWNNDGVQDKAMLVENITDNSSDVDDIDFIVMESNGKSGFKETVLTGNTGKALSPKLSLNKKNSIVLEQDNENIGAGRGLWNSKTLFTYRDNEFYLSGYSMSAADKLDLSILTCDINLLTGDFVLNGKKGHLKAGKWPITLKTYRNGASVPNCEDFLK